MSRLAAGDIGAAEELYDRYAGQVLALARRILRDDRDAEDVVQEVFSVAADQLPVPPPGRVYQVWLIGGGAPVSAGLLGTPRTGRGMLIAPPPGGLARGPITVAVTDEPPGGLPAPTGAKHLVGSI